MAEIEAGFWTPVERWQRDRPNTYLLAAALIVFAILTVLFPLYALSDVDAHTGIPMKLDNVPQGVSAVPLGDSRVFLVRAQREVLGFDSNSPHLGAPLWWCPQERVFVAVPTGEVFDQRGRLLWGQSPTDMNAFEVDVLEDRVLLRPDQPLPAVQAHSRTIDDLPPDVRRVAETGTCDAYVA